MHYHLVTKDGAGAPPAVRTIKTSTDAEREALSAAMRHGDWAPKRYPGRTWRRGEVAVYLDRISRLDRPPVHRELSILRCAASSELAHDCLLQSMGIPALNLEPVTAPEPAGAPVVIRGQRAG